MFFPVAGGVPARGDELFAIVSSDLVEETYLIALICCYDPLGIWSFDSDVSVRTQYAITLSK
jgi:hypothetical protein